MCMHILLFCVCVGGRGGGGVGGVWWWGGADLQKRGREVYALCFVPEIHLLPDFG